MRERFSALVQTGPGAHPAYYTTGMGLAQELSSWGMALTIHSHLALRLREE